MADHAGVHNLTSMQEFQEAKAKGGVMVIDFYATWCGPCKVISPKVVEFAKQYPDACFYKVDVDEVPDVAQELSIRAMPTFILFKDGSEHEKVVGASAGPLETAIKAALA